MKGFSAKSIREELDTGASKAELEIAYSQSRREFGELVSRQVAFIGMLAAAAPLLGLLGTVMGMLETFESPLSESAGNGDPGFGWSAFRACHDPGGFNGGDSRDFHHTMDQASSERSAAGNGP